MFRSFAVAAGVVTCAFIQPALAQTPERGVTVTERPRPDFDPLGVRLGGFLLFPELAVSETYDDNIFAEEANTVDDFITTISPNLLLRSDWNRHYLQFTAGADVALHADNTDENYEHYDFGTHGRLDILRNTNVRGGVNYRALTEERGSPDDVNGEEPTEYTEITPFVGAFHRWNRVSLDVEGGAEKLDFDDVSTAGGTPINNDDRDRTRYSVTTRLGYEIQPEYEAFLRAQYNTVNYDDAVDDVGLTRDSDGYEVVAGTRIDFTGLLFGDVFAGYRSQDYDDPTLQTVDGFTYGGALTWNVTELTTIQASVVRTVEETTQSGASGYFSTEYGASVDHELLRNLLVGARFSYTLNDYEGITREDDVYNAGVYGRYLMHRNLYLSLSYDYRERDSNVAGADFDKNIFMVRLETQL